MYDSYVHLLFPDYSLIWYYEEDGFFCGAILRKILKILVIIMGLGLGLFFLGIQYMANKGYLESQINWDRVGNDTAIII